MNTTLKPTVLPTSAAQTPTAKPMHPQGAPASFGQPSGHVSQNPFPNMNVAHAQQNHYGMTTGAHFNMGTIPASNHPVASLNQAPAQQLFGGPQKTLPYSVGGFQGSMGHQQNQNTLPPVSQTLPATGQSQPQPLAAPNPPQTTPSSTTNSAMPTSDANADRPQSNGTSELKPEPQGNCVQPPTPSPQTPTPQITQGSPEKPKPTPIVQEQKPPPEPDSAKPPEEPDAAQSPPTPVPSEPQPQDERKVSNTEPEPAPSPAKPTEAAESPVESNKEEIPEETTLPAVLEKEKSPEPQEVSSESNGTTPVSVEEDKEPSEAEKNPEKEAAESIAAEPEVPAETKPKEQPTKKEASPLKLATTPRTPVRKSKTPKSEDTKPAKAELKTPVSALKSPSTSKAKRQRIRTQPYQSPLPEIEIVTKISTSTPRNKANDDRLIIFYKNEFMAVRNAEGGFYLCQAVQNIYKSSSKIKIRWLSQDKSDKSGEIYTPDFYDLTDFDCILTSLDLSRVDKGKFRLSAAEKERTDSILKRCLAVEKGEIVPPSLSEEHPDGLDLSLYKDEEQLKKKRATKRKSRPSSATSSRSPDRSAPAKKSPDAPKVRKVEAVAAKPAKKPPAKKPVAKKPAAAPPPTEPKKAPAASSRSARGKRKSDTKTVSPVVDQKKAKVLAKIGRKTAIPASTSRSQTKAKSAKVTKPTPSSSKQTKSAPVTAERVASTRKAKRSSRK